MPAGFGDWRLPAAAPSPRRNADHARDGADHATDDTAHHSADHPAHDASDDASHDAADHDAWAPLPLAPPVAAAEHSSGAAAHRCRRCGVDRRFGGHVGMRSVFFGTAALMAAGAIGNLLVEKAQSDSLDGDCSAV